MIAEMDVALFFFQAEDGIRDVAVTGVQTCALPISWTWAPPIAATCPNHAATLHREAGLQLSRAEYESRRTGSKFVRTSSGCAPLKADASTRTCLVKTPRVTTPNVVWVKSWV